MHEINDIEQAEIAKGAKGVKKDFDIPGTFVFTPAHARQGYHLNMFCMSLNKTENREAFRADPSAYLDKFKLTPAQRKAVETRDWLGMLQLGGNIYYTFKIAIADGLSMQHVSGCMAGISEEEFRQMMRKGGRRLGDPHTE
ncbi:MAG: protocatechuate 4,5-dioxygenase subunit alpha [Alphaproteobacteria bacterium]|nr:protocatechuate 4,5-dioxygenase subunit alpha [Alphaproteobacteria bacterium]